MYKKTIVLKTRSGVDAGAHTVQAEDKYDFERKWSEAWDKYSLEAVENSLYIFASPAGDPEWTNGVRRFGPSAQKED